MDDITRQAEIRKYLRAERKKRGWSQEKLALNAGFSTVYIMGLENGRREFSMADVMKLFDVQIYVPARLLRPHIKQHAKKHEKKYRYPLPCVDKRYYPGDGWPRGTRCASAHRCHNGINGDCIFAKHIPIEVVYEKYTQKAGHVPAPNCGSKA